ncbi:MAG: cupin domain-containing protein [Anaerolineae bacterium]|nr:cupin domain-containing protein [Anaerolineae bacterium]
MTVVKYHETPAQAIREGAERRIGHTDNLMIVVVDFYDGPKDEPDALYSHPHEQVSYVAEGEVIFVMDGRQTHLGPGDVFLVPSGRPHSIRQLTGHVRLVDCFTPLREDFL